jgi:signal peptidase
MAGNKYRPKRCLLDIRKVLKPVINLGLVISTALFIYNTLKIITNTEGPITVVLSDSMAPGFWRGDILFLYHSSRPVSVGEIIVYKIPGKEIPIVHRVLQIHQSAQGDGLILTKGDNNPGDDRPIFYDADPTLHYLTEEHIIGRVYGIIPYVGYVTIIMSEYPIVKFILLGALALYSIVLDNTREQ